MLLLSIDLCAPCACTYHDLCVEVSGLVEPLHCTASLWPALGAQGTAATSARFRHLMSHLGQGQQPHRRQAGRQAEMSKALRAGAREGGREGH